MTTRFGDFQVKDHRVLLADDDAMIRNTLRQLLETCGYVVLLADDGQEALDKARTLSPDVVLLDIMMPKLDGLDVCRRLKSDPATASIPVLILTALAEHEDLIKGVAAGADEFLSKPIDREELTLRVRNAAYRKYLYDELERKYGELKAMSDLHKSLAGMIEADTDALSSMLRRPKQGA